MSTFESEVPVTQPASTLRLGLSFFAFLLIGGYESGLGVLVPSLRADYGLNKAVISLLFLGGTAGYFIAAFLSGWLAVKWGRLSLLLIALSSFALGAIGYSFRPPFQLLLFMPLLLGFGIAVMEAWLNAYIAKLPDSRVLLNYLHASFGLGALLGPTLAEGILNLGLGWHRIYQLWFVVAACLSIGFGRSFANFDLDRIAPEKNSVEQSGESEIDRFSTDSRSMMGRVWTSPLVWTASLFLIVYVGAEHSLGDWSYSFLLEERHENPVAAGFKMSGYWCGMALCRLSIGKLASWFSSRQLVNFCLGGAIVGLLILWLVPSTYASALGLATVGFCFGPMFPAIIELVADYLPSYLLLSANSTIGSMGNLGTSVVPWIVGNLAERWSLQILCPYALMLTLMTIFFWIGLLRLCPSPSEPSPADGIDT